ncbi:MAG: response regulator [Chloroflexi bacterium]|nr:response regulator [Chloroflexota bacterium]MCH9016476.1 response regulator [Chloroflexota bacterium]
MSTPLRVLIVEDQEDDAALMLRELRRAQFEPEYERVETEQELSAALEKGGWEVVLSDHGLPKFNSLQALSMLHESGLDLPFIIVSGSIGEDLAVAAMKSGAHDYIMKNNLARLGPAVERELREAEVRRANKIAEEQRQKLVQELEQAYTQLERRVRQITASIMFTDLEGSTQMLTRLGDEENQVLLASHRRIIRQQLDNHGGQEVKTTGDGFMIAFYSARKAVSCAVDIQKDLREFNIENPDRQLKVRIGLNLGEVIKEEDDYFGSTVVMAARIMDESAGGQILVSDLLMQVANGPSNTEHKYSDFGMRTLKGFDDQEHIFEVLWQTDTP